jgi:hypothetical protein
MSAARPTPDPIDTDATNPVIPGCNASNPEIQGFLDLTQQI